MREQSGKQEDSRCNLLHVGLDSINQPIGRHADDGDADDGGADRPTPPKRLVPPITVAERSGAARKILRSEALLLDMIDPRMPTKRKPVRLRVELGSRMGNLRASIAMP